MSFASLVEPVPHESRSEEESSEERPENSRLSRLMRSARGGAVSSFEFAPRARAPRAGPRVP